MLEICLYFIAYSKISLCFMCFLKYTRSDFLRVFTKFLHFLSKQFKCNFIKRYEYGVNMSMQPKLGWHPFYLTSGYHIS